MSARTTHVLPSVGVGECDEHARADGRTIDFAIRELLRRGFYCRVSQRLDVSRLGRWQRRGYLLFCRYLPSWCRFPGAPLVERGGLASFAAADAQCVTPDDVLQILPFGWTYGGGAQDPEVGCRPRDEADAANYERLKEVFGKAVADRPLISAVELRSLLEEVAQCRRMAAPRAKRPE